MPTHSVLNYYSKMNSDDSDSDEGSVVYDSSSHDDPEGFVSDEGFQAKLPRIRQNDPRVKRLDVCGEFESVQDMTYQELEQLGRDISNNTHLHTVCFFDYALNDHKMSFLFRGLTRSSSMKELTLQFNNQLSAIGVRCMVPFLQNGNNLQLLDLTQNNLQSEGFNFLFRELRDSPIEKLYCSTNNIATLDIDVEHIPRNLKRLYLGENNIDADGCRELAKLLQGEDATLRELDLGNNKINDEGVAVLVHALNRNTSLKELDLGENDGISKQGEMMLLKPVGDLSSIKATLQSNHTLEDLKFSYEDEEDEQIQRHIDMATAINSENSPENAASSKVIQFQLNSVKRGELADLQGVSHSLYSEINPLHLPEVLALVGQHHGKGELYVALNASIAGIISTVNRKECLKQQIAHDKAKIAEYEAKVEAAAAEIEAIEAAEGLVLHIGRSNKKRRV